MSKILFFDPPSRENVYLDTNVSVGVPNYPSLTLATLAGNLTKEHTIKIVDLDLLSDYRKYLFDTVEHFKPDIIASSANTPEYLSVKDIMHSLKAKYPSIVTIVGGAHITAMPEAAAKEDCFDIIAAGEGDTAISEILSLSVKDVHGIIYKDADSGERVGTPAKKPLNDLNGLPYPAWRLFDLKSYKNSRLSARKNPVGLIETSRGCAFNCNFCNKLIFGNRFRPKDPKRTVNEIEYMLACGFKEVHIIDDNFAQDINRAKEICIEIMNRNLKFPWSLFSGVRVDAVDFEFFKLAKKAGCWQVAFGIETGDQDILNRINKKITLSQIENAVKMAKKADLSTFGFFILALAGETEASMKHTIEFSKRLPLDIAKFDICIPYPGTAYYNELRAQGRIRSENWSRYVCHQVNEPLFDHAHLAWDTIRAYYKKAFREFYLRPQYIARRFMRSLKMGDLLFDVRPFLCAKW